MCDTVGVECHLTWYTLRHDLIMPIHPSQLAVDALVSDCEIRRQRRSGPGGQHRNKVETGIFIEHRPSGVRAEATEKRSQVDNQELAVFRLRLSLAVELRSSAESAPGDLWKSRVRGGKIKVNERHADFPALIAEALNVLHDLDWDTKPAAERLNCSTSQLVKFLKQEPRAFGLLNRERETRGRGKLK